MINRDELDDEDILINYDDNGQEKDQDELGLSIIKENQDPVNEEDIYTTEEREIMKLTIPT